MSNRIKRDSIADNHSQMGYLLFQDIFFLSAILDPYKLPNSSGIGANSIQVFNNLANLLEALTS
jgi:hypothetical protein